MTFEEGAQLPTKIYCGGPTKDHILESACGGVALFDYDGDGLLDIYLVTGAELTPARERIPHRNALYRNLGGWKFEDVSKRAGVDLAAWGSGACAGDFDGDGRLDLYVTNWGPNVAVPQPRRRHVRGRRRARRSRGGRLEHRLHVLRRRRRRRPRPLRRALRRDDLGLSCARAAVARLAQRAPHHGRPGRTSGRIRSVLRERRQWQVRRGDRSARPRRSVEGVRIRRRRDGLRRRWARRSVRGERLESKLPLSQPRKRPLRERWSGRRRRR